MPFAALDDGFHSNSKIIDAGNEAAGLYARALSYIAAQGSDGFVSKAWAHQAAVGNKKLPAILTHENLWQPVRKGDAAEIVDRSGNEITVEFDRDGYFILDYTQFNFSSVETAKRRKQASDAGRKGALLRWSQDGESDGGKDGEIHSGKHGGSHSGRHSKRHSSSMASGIATRARAQAPGPSPLTPESPTPGLESDLPVGSSATRAKPRSVKPPVLKSVDQAIGGAA